MEASNYQSCWVGKNNFIIVKERLLAMAVAVWVLWLTALLAISCHFPAVLGELDSKIDCQEKILNIYD